MDKKTAELLSLLQSVNGMTKGAALAEIKSLTAKGQAMALSALRLEKLEREGQLRLGVGDAPRASPESKANKVPYTLLMPPALLEAVKAAVELEGLSVSQFIRSAVADKLRGRK